MAKFLDKKEQVYDLKLTTYGHYLLSIGSFKPIYYAFFDDNISYDRQYFISHSIEPQNDIRKRIQEETPYLESIVMFDDPEKHVQQLSTTNIDLGTSMPAFAAEVTPTTMVPQKSIYKFDNAIGDAFLEGDTQAAPAWKLVMLNGEISSSMTKDTTVSTGFDVQVPQVNITLNYRKKVVPADFIVDPSNMRDLDNRTGVFADNKVITLEMDDALIYLDEVNTQLLTENFDIEVFEVTDTTGSIAANNLNRKYFERFIPQIVDGFMTSPTQRRNPVEDLDSKSVEYYFDVLVDEEIDEKFACKGADVFNKESYYVDIDFECTQPDAENVYYDIYGSVTEPEICQD